MATTETTTAAHDAALQALTPGTWTIDTAHSSVEFIARHVMIAKTKGRFHDFEGAITIAENPLDSKVEATIDMASVDTKDAQRDEHLRSGDFFDVANHPKMTFVSREVRPDDGDYLVQGDLTIRGVTRPVVLTLEFNGVSPDPWGGTRAGFTARTEINRRDFGLEWNVALDSGGVLVGEKVKIELEIEAVRA